jgi:acyl-coenzyme A thioesterase PaaI-like protein
VNKLLRRYLRIFLNVWPPFLGAGIRVTRLQPDWREIDVQMKLRRWNSNYVGTHYGGSLFSMADPFYMVMLIENLGPEYVVWDKSVTVRFRKPGKGTVTANFRLTDQQLGEIRQALETTEKFEKVFAIEITDESGATVAEVEKLIHIRKKANRS